MSTALSQLRRLRSALPQRADQLAVYAMAGTLSLACVALLLALVFGGSPEAAEPEPFYATRPRTQAFGGEARARPTARAALQVPEPAGQSEDLRMVWPIGNRFITSSFGARVDPVSGFGLKRHRGVDIRSDCGTPVLATLRGKVTSAQWSTTSGWVVKIQHPNGMLTRYAHLSELHVSSGEQVRAGERLGLSGATGRTTGPHLHFEIWKNDAPRNPMAYRYRYLPDASFKPSRVSSWACGSGGVSEYEFTATRSQSSPREAQVDDLLRSWRQGS